MSATRADGPPPTPAHSAVCNGSPAERTTPVAIEPAPTATSVENTNSPPPTGQRANPRPGSTGRLTPTGDDDATRSPVLDVERPRSTSCHTPSSLWNRVGTLDTRIVFVPSGFANTSRVGVVNPSTRTAPDWIRERRSNGSRDDPTPSGRFEKSPAGRLGDVLAASPVDVSALGVIDAAWARGAASIAVNPAAATTHAKPTVHTRRPRATQRSPPMTLPPAQTSCPAAPSHARTQDATIEGASAHDGPSHRDGVVVSARLLTSLADASLIRHAWT